mgnify:CR=1 FL=1
MADPYQAVKFQIWPVEGGHRWELYWSFSGGCAFCRSRPSKPVQTKKQAKAAALHRAQTRNAPAFVVGYLKKGTLARPSPKNVSRSGILSVFFPHADMRHKRGLTGTDKTDKC